MIGMNRVLIAGNLGADPEEKTTASGLKLARLRVATSQRSRKPDGTVEEHTEWHNVVVWDKTAEHCVKYLHKGDPVFVEGALRTNAYKTKEGVERKDIEIRATDVRFLGQRPRDELGDRGDVAVYPLPMSA